MQKRSGKSNILIGFFLTSYFFTAVCVVVLAIIVPPILKNATQRYEVNKELADLRKQIASLEAGNSDLEKLKTYLQSDQFAEKEARLNFGLKMKGEQVAVIERSAAAGAGGSAAAAGENKNSNPVKWWNYLFGR